MKGSPMKYGLLVPLVCTFGFVACTDDKSVVNSTPEIASATAAKMTVSENKAGGGTRSGLVTQGVRERVSTANPMGLTVSAGAAGGYRGIAESAEIFSIAPPPYTRQVISDDEQAMIEEKLAVLTEFYAADFPDHFLILVGDSENLVDDMTCNSHDESVVERMLSVGTPRFLHLADSLAMSPSNATFVDENGRYLNQKYREAPPHIKDAIDYVNRFAGHEGAVNDDSTFVINYSSDDGSIYNGKCRDLGNHHLGLFKDTIVVREMNNAGYGNTTWNGLPVYGNTVLADFTIAGINWKLKFDTSNLKFFLRRNENATLCKQWVWNQQSAITFIRCAAAQALSAYVQDIIYRAF